MTALSRRQLTMAALGTLALGSAHADGSSSYPNRPVTLIVPFAAGGGTDVSMRIIARHFQRITGQPMTVENRPGGGTMVALSALTNQKPDGYTLGTMTRAHHVAFHTSKGKVPVHPLHDLTYIAATHGSIFGMVVRADSPFRSLPDVVAYAKANPGKLSFGNIGVGTAHNLIALEFAQLAGIEVLHASFKGEADSNTAAMGGHVDISVSSGVMIPMVQGGKMRVLGIATTERLAGFSDWQTLREQGYDIQMDTSVGIGGPKGMPSDVVAKLNEVVRQITADPAFKTALMQVWQTVHYLPTPAYRQAHELMFYREKLLMEQHKLIT
jgi:tripartite-type tricarboxylate transporter receptor subunit TctC